MKKILLLLLLLSTIQNSYCQEILNNQSVVDMFELGFEEQTIIDKIESTNSDFDTSIEALKSLKQSGLTPSLLSVMIKASKSRFTESTEKQKKALPPKPNDTEFYWKDGKGELVKVSFLLNIGRDFTMDESELAGFTHMIMTQAKMELKVPSSFRPASLVVRKRLKQDKYLTKNNNTEYVIQLGSSGTNSYGGVVDGITLLGINPKLIPLEKTEDDILQEQNAKDFKFSKVYMDGKSMKMSGKITIQKDFLLMDYETGATSPPIPIKEKDILGVNHWKVESNMSGMKSIIEYNANETKYNTDGGVLIFISMGQKMVYPLSR
jgi:hypothetical protein